MTRIRPPRTTARRSLVPGVAALREPASPARTGRCVVRRRARGMDADDVAAALADARSDARQVSRPEDLPDDAHGPAELAEWERIDVLLAGAPAGTVYDPYTDIVVQAELAADAAADARKAHLEEVARVEARAGELQALRDLGTLEEAEPRGGDEAVRDELTRRAGGYAQDDVDGWLAHALAAGLGHYRSPGARDAAAGLLPAPVLAHAALLTELAAWPPPRTPTSWRSPRGSRPRTPTPPARSPHSSPASGRKRACGTVLSQRRCVLPPSSGTELGGSREECREKCKCLGRGTPLFPGRRETGR